MKNHYFRLLFLLMLYSNFGIAQNLLPTPTILQNLDSEFVIKNAMTIAYDKNAEETANYLQKRLKNYVDLRLMNGNDGDIVLFHSEESNDLGKEGYHLSISSEGIKIAANTEAGFFYGVQSLLQLFPIEVQASKMFDLSGFVLKGIEVKDLPKYGWRSFMLDSGRQYQSPEFIKRYLDYMAMLKMNVFHWHLTEGQGWRIEIKKYPKLTDIGSKVANGKEQHGYYTQEMIKDIIAYADQLHISVVPEIDVPGHSEAALIAYPELTCFGEAPETVMTFSPTLFCAGNEKTYEFLENVLDEVCELFPASYIHLGGDEAPKDNWNRCPKCQKKIQEEDLKDAHGLQQYFSARLANYLKAKDKKVIFWGDVVYDDGPALPDNVVVMWWNSRAHGDLALQNAIKRSHQVIGNTNQYAYLNFPVSPWDQYKKERTFDMQQSYNHNASDLKNPPELFIGMGTSLWTDWNVTENLVDRRVFPRIFALVEQMWSTGERLPFNEFYDKVKKKYPLLTALGIDYGPALLEEVPVDYKWD